MDLSSEQQWLQILFAWLNEHPELGSSEQLDQLRDTIAQLPAHDFNQLLQVLAGQNNLLGTSSRYRLLMQWIAARALVLFSADAEEEFEDLKCLEPLYEKFLETDQTEAAAHTMQILASAKDRHSLSLLSELLVSCPPQNWQMVGLALSPLWQAPADKLLTFFDFLRDKYLQPSAFCVVIDLANYSVRQNKLSRHPWYERTSQLRDLFSSIVMRLRKLEKEPQQFGGSVEEIQQVLSDCLAMTVSLCDALAIIGDKQAIEVLAQALVLSHRRIQTEAAGALASLGDDRGKQRLIELAEDRVARIRAVAYAREMGVEDQIAPEFRTPQALAESQLAAWLAAPEQFGIPPSDMELVDQRTQYWPSFDEPRQCFLFRYSYALPDGHVSNVGIVGPLTQAFSADLANLPVDDIYAAFAGWQAEHEEIFEVPTNQFNLAQSREASRLCGWLQDRNFESLEPVALTFFFGEVALLSYAFQESRKLCVITDGQELVCLPVTDLPTSITPETVLCLYRGRKLLRTFNP